MTKQELRTQYKSIIKSFDNKTKSQLILTQLLIHKHFLNAKNILLFASTNFEPNIWPLINTIKEFDNKVFYFPCVDSLELGKVDNIDGLIKGSHEIFIPKAISKFPSEGIDLVILPGLAFDKKGYRLGHGSGWYDRFFAIHRNDIKYIIGVCFKEQLSPTLPHEEFDIKVDQVISD